MSDIVINLLVTGFVLAMGYVWYIYGLFSALLHLVVTICAGALALAVWEPLVYGVLLGINTHFAWAAGLLLPFGVLLAAGRFAINKAVPEDLDLPTLVSSLGGAACGLASGVLTAGLTLMGASLLPLPTNVLGYEPYIVEADGEVALQADGDGQLWFAVDEMAADFFSWASAGGLGSSTPLHRYRPELARSVATARLARSYDPNQNLYSHPDSVDLSVVHSVDAQMLEEIAELDPAVRRSLLDTAATGDFVLAETIWQSEPGGAYDSDATLRLPPVQVRLMSLDEDGENPRYHDPIAFVGKTAPGARDLHYYPIDDNLTLPYGFASTDVPIRWVFHVPGLREPASLTVRMLRLPIDEQELLTNRGPAFADALGTFAPGEGGGDAEDDPADTRVGDRSGLGGAIRQTTQLPESFDKNKAPAVETVQADRGQRLRYGTASIDDVRARAGRRTTVSAFDLASHQRMVRLQITGRLGEELIDSLRGLPPGEGIYFVDDRGSRLYPFAYVWLGPQDNMELEARRNFAPIEASRDLPIRSINFETDRFYLFFVLPPNTLLEEIRFGERTSRELDMLIK